jgi:dTDP-4-dehydrorhamnose reductase
MKILLFGKGGQVGWELQRSLAPLGELVAVDFDSTDYCGDFTNLVGLAETIRAIAPDIIVNAAAHTAVDKAESEPELARTINALAPAVLAQEARQLGAWLVHYSIDYVFDGSGNEPWIETSPAGSLSVYGQTKLEGEKGIRASCRKHLIFCRRFNS